MRSDLISRIVILSSNSPGEMGTWISVVIEAPGVRCKYSVSQPLLTMNDSRRGTRDTTDKATATFCSRPASRSFSRPLHHKRLKLFDHVVRRNQIHDAFAFDLGGPRDFARRFSEQCARCG